MIVLVLAILLDASIRQGDHWVTERTSRLIQEQDQVDLKSVDRREYSVLHSTQEGTVLLVKVIPGAGSQTQMSNTQYTFRPNGVLLSAEDATEPDQQRINRLVWTALEAREGLSWSRHWPDIGGLLSADVRVKPTSKTQDEVTLAITYTESGKTKSVATLKIFKRVRIIEDLALTINNVSIPGHIKLGSLVVTEKMKDLRLQSR